MTKLLKARTLYFVNRANIGPTDFHHIKVVMLKDVPTRLIFHQLDFSVSQTSKISDFEFQL